MSTVGEPTSQPRPKEQKTTPREHVCRFPRSDAGNAEYFASLYENQLRYDHKRKRWLAWAGNWWIQDVDGLVNRLAKRAARLRLRDAANLEGKDDRQHEAEWALTSESRPRLEATVKLAQSEKPLADPGMGWDSDAYLLGVANGVVDLRTGMLREGRPSDCITLHTNVPFNPTAKCPRWEQFLSEIFNNDAELVDFIYRAIGYSLTGDTREQCLFLCYGEGANGKTTLFEALRYVLGDYAGNTPFSTLELKGRASIPNDVAALVGKRFVTAAETNEAVRLNEARVKALTGSDPIPARFLYGEWFNIRWTAKFWLAFNHKPLVSDDSYGFWRRIRLIPFPRKFAEEEADKELLSNLQAEAQGILAWAVRGCLAWQVHGLKPPTVVKDATQNYREESDSLEEFITERCIVEEEARTPKGRLWEEYQRWVKENGLHCPLDRKGLSERLEQRGYEGVRVGHERTRCWKGLALRSETEAVSVPLGADTRTDADSV